MVEDPDGEAVQTLCEQAVKSPKMPRVFGDQSSSLELKQNQSQKDFVYPEGNSVCNTAPVNLVEMHSTNKLLQK